MIYKIVVDKQPMTNPSEEKKEYEIDIEELRFKRDVYDSLVITLNEDYVMRRLSLSEYNVLTVLDEPIKEPLENINIELFEGDNYIYLYDMAGNKIVAQYLVKNEFNELYITQSEMNSAIEQSAKAIELSVNGKIARVDGDIEDLSANLELKVDKNDNDQIVSMINASADEIKLKSNRLIIDSTNFKLNSAGNITATGGDIGGFNLGATKLKGNLNGIYNYNIFDATIALCTSVNMLILDNVLKEICDLDGNNIVTADDALRILKILKGIETNTKRETGTFEINSEDPKNCISIKKNGEIVVSIGLGGVNTNMVTTKNFVCGSDVGTTTGFQGTTINSNGQILCSTFEGVKTTIDYTGIITPKVTQTSKAEEKKNFEELENGLDIVKNTDIYKYNMKFENDEDKKHIGFVIGDKFKYREEITSKENDGVDVYSFVSVCCKAIQEQQEQIEKLQKENQQKDEILANLIERLEKLEKEGQIC